MKIDVLKVSFSFEPQIVFCLQDSCITQSLATWFCMQQHPLPIISLSSKHGLVWLVELRVGRNKMVWMAKQRLVD